MSTYLLPLFGKIDLTSLEHYYDAQMEWEDRTISLDLNFEEKTIEASKLDFVKQFIENLSIYDANNKVFMEADFENEEKDTVRLYTEWFLEGLNAEKIAAFVDVQNLEISIQKQFISKLQLVRIGFYPCKEDPYAIFDYSIDEDLTNYLVVIYINSLGQLQDMTIES